MFFKLALVSCVVAYAYAQHGYGHGGNYGHSGTSYSSLSLGNSHYGASAGHALAPVAVAHAAPVYAHAAPIHSAPIIASHGYGAGYGHGHGHGHDYSQDYYAHPQYQFHYGVADAHTGDHHSQQESRDGDAVHGEYSLHQPDGTVRTVKYQADDKSGFNAQVIVSGHASHPQSYAPAKYVAHGHGHY
ncbi:hypothetical protein RN001_008858 [Aquatica leii]|uniref:Uncharacterized protein n=1 Tax=Aquatica leii TaxID=1421715 RepID=A0AAN7SH39_9COLE|nr:hypothetical protein RN001_008858 [Aquatica leii]